MGDGGGWPNLQSGWEWACRQSTCGPYGRVEVEVESERAMGMGMAELVLTGAFVPQARIDQGKDGGHGLA